MAAAGTKSEKLKIYFEKQSSLNCAVHAVNNLMQSAVFCEDDFHRFALKMDQAENRLLAQPLAVNENRDQSGNFSIQVIIAVLEKASLTVHQINSESAVEKKIPLHMEQGFIFNRNGHWLSLRRVNEVWYSLDSLAPAPTKLTDIYLAAYIDAMRDAKGYSCFVVRGTFPLPVSSQDYSKSQIKGRGFWIMAELICSLGDPSMASNQASMIPAEAAALADPPASRIVSKAETVITGGIKLVTEAIELENCGRLEEAYVKYKTGLACLLAFMKTLKDGKYKANLRCRIADYMARAEELKRELEKRYQPKPGDPGSGMLAEVSSKGGTTAGKGNQAGGQGVAGEPNRIPSFLRPPEAPSEPHLPSFLSGLGGFQ